MEVKIAIFSRQNKSADGRKFTTYSTKYAFRNADGTRTKRYIRVRFTEDAQKNSAVDLKSIKRGIIVVDSAFVGCPDVYEITKDVKTNKDVYPVCWIRGGVKEYGEILKEHEFHFDADMDDEETSDEEIGELESETQEG